MSDASRLFPVRRLEPSLLDQIRFEFLREQQQGCFAVSRETVFDHVVAMMDAQIETEVIPPDRVLDARGRM